MIRAQRPAACAAAIFAALALTAPGAVAQQGPAEPTAGNGTTGSSTQPAGGAGGAGAAGGGGASAQPSVPQAVLPYGFQPPPPGQPIGGGNATESSARTVSGEQEDSFDLAPKAGGGGTAYGGANGPVFLGGESRVTGAPAGPPPDVHVVRRGDTLWGICDSYFRNPYQWPRIWSYNPQIQNPHWIYPNEQVRLRAGAALGPAAPPTQATGQEGPGLGAISVARGGRVPPETVFLRDEGFVDDEQAMNWGSISGAPEDKMFLTDFDQAYLRIGPDHDVALGQELTVYRPLRKVGSGEVIQIQGTARVNQWNPQTRIARAQIVETLDTIERGARVGPMTRRFEVVPPVRNEADVRARVALAVRPHVFYGQGQVVFVDKGADDGLRPGNRLFVVRRGDAWRGSMGVDQTANRIPLEKDTVGEVEPTPKMRDESKLPEEVIGELRVLHTQKHSAACLVTRSSREIETNDEAVARRGY